MPEDNINHVLINPNGEAEAIPAAKSDAAIGSGYQVPLIDEHGQTVYANDADVPTLINQYGHTQPSPEQLNKLLEETKYTSPSQKIKGAIEGAMEIPSFGTAGAAEAALGISPAEEQAKRAEYNPWTRISAAVAVPIAGMAASALVPEAAPIILPLTGAGGPVVGAIKLIGETAGALANVGKFAKVLSPAAKYATEGLLYAIPHEMNESLLGNPDQNAQSMATHMGASALFSGALGVLLSPFAKSAEKTLEKKAISSAMSKFEPSAAIAEEAGIPVVPEEFAGQEGAIRRNRLAETDKIINTTGPQTQLPVLPQQLEAVSDRVSKSTHANLAEGHDDLGQAIRDHASGQKLEAEAHLATTIDSLAPNKDITGDEIKAGRNVINSIKEQQAAEKAEMAPGWKQFDESRTSDISDPNNINTISTALGNAIPGVEQHISLDGTGQLLLAKYEPAMGFKRPVYNAIKDIVNELNNPNATLGRLRNIQELIGESAREAERGSQSQMYLRNMSKELLNYVADQVPDLDFRNLIKRYAINKSNRDTFETILGGKLDAFVKHGQKIAPEDSLKNIFSDVNSVEAAKAILPKDVFNEALANHLKANMNAVSNDAKGGFNSNAFSRFLGKKNYELTSAFSDNPNQLERIKALSDKHWMLPEATPGNPSRTMTQGLNYLEMLMLNPRAAVLKMAGGAAKKIAIPSESDVRLETWKQMGKNLPAAQVRQEAHKQFAMLSAAQHISSFALSTAKSIKSGVGKLFQFAEPQVGRAGGALGEEISKDLGWEKKPKGYAKGGVVTEDLTAPQEMHPIAEKALKLSNNPELLVDHISKMVEPIQAAPKTTMALAGTVSRMADFLASKVPPTGKLGPLNPERTPSRDEISKFNHYARTVDNPLSVLPHVRNGTLLPQHVEALQSIYPDLYGQMRQEMMGKISEFVSKRPVTDIPYKMRIGLSKFMGENLDSALNQPNLMNNQVALASTQAQKQDQDAQALKPSKSGMGKMKNSVSTQTRAQQTAARQGRAL